MDSPHPILSASKELLHSLEVWFNGQTVQVQGVARMALEECWNSYYALSESTKTKDSKQQKENIAALYLDIARLKATLGMTEGGTRPDAIQEQAQLLRAWMETQAPEQEQTATVSSSSSKSIPLTVPPSPTPRPEKLKTVSTDEQAHVSPEQLERLLTGYAPASGLSHEHIAHEMIMDPNFKLYKREPESELEARVRTLATKAFFDRIREELTQGHPEISIPSLMNEIQGRLISLVREDSPWIERMKEYFDIPLMEQRMAHGAFELDTTIDTVLGFMLQMCAPARDEAIQTVYLLQDSVDRIQSIMEILQDMVFDLMNFRLSTLRPVLMPIAVEYEKQKFAEALSHGQVGLAKTRGWLQSTYHRVKEATAQRHPEAAPSVPAMTVVFEEAFSSLVTSKTPIMRPTCPETLLLDLDRMAMYQREAHAIITTAALVMLARNFGTQCPLETLAKTLLVMLEDTSISIEHLTAQIKRDIPDTTQHAMIQSMVEKTVSQEDMVYTLLTRRVGTIVRYQLSTGQWVQKEVVVSSGLDYVHQPLKGLCHKLNILASHHRQVYASWYESILHDEQTYPSSS